MAGDLILVVDDDPAIVEVLRCLLHDAGYAVATATTARPSPWSARSSPV
jgi:CheY-like chemotaxis protein